MTCSREWHRAYQRKYYRDKKQKLIEVLGGKCSRCLTVEDLQFDHIDPLQKSFSISKFLNYSWARTLKELKKCQLLCRNCHLKKTSEGRDGFDKKARGEDVSTSKLTESQVREIKRLILDGVGPRAIARQFGVCRSNIQAIKRGQTWGHVR